MLRKIVFVFFTLLMLSSCGLKTFYKIDPPQNADPPNTANGDIVSSPTQEREFAFTAQDLTAAFFTSSGTDVYYRIYTEQEDLQADASQVDDANDDDNNNGYKQIISLGYKKLKSTRGGENPLIDTSGGRIIIQPADDTLKDAFVSVSGSVSGFIPLRFNEGYFNFNDTYNSDDDDYSLPTSGDDDYDEGATVESYFLNAYAVSVGMDISTFSQVQSEILSLGFIAYDLD